MVPQGHLVATQVARRAEQAVASVPSAGKASALFIVIIIANAYAVAVNYNINGIIEKNNSLRGDIEVISVEINSAKNIQNIEKKAMSEFGMVAPTANKCIYAKGSGKSKKKTAMAQNPDN